MSKKRKITVEIPADLLSEAQLASGAGVAQTACTGLQLVAASNAYEKLRRLRGKVRFSKTAAELKAERSPQRPKKPRRGSMNEITEAMNRVCERLGNTKSDPFVAEVARQTLQRSEWVSPAPHGSRSSSR